MDVRTRPRLGSEVGRSKKILRGASRFLEDKQTRHDASTETGIAG